MAEVEQKLQPSGQPTDGMTVAATSPGRSLAVNAHAAGVPKPDLISGWRDRLVGRLRPGIGGTSGRPRPGRCGRRRSARSRSGTLAMCPPMTIVALGLILADQLAHLLALSASSGMISMMPITSYCCVRISSMKRSSVGKSSTAQGASMFAWISIRPQLR